MNTTSTPIFHHYVPQFQLRYLTEKDGKLWVYDRKYNLFKRKTPKSIAGEKKLYTYTDNDRNENTDIEDLNTLIETTTAPIIKDLHYGGKKTLNAQDKAELSVLLALNWMRTPTQRERMLLYLEAGATMHMRLNALNKEIFYQQVEEIQRKSGLSFGDVEELRKSILENRYRIQFDNLAYLQSLMINLLGLSNEIQRMKWTISILKNNKRAFVLSDINFTVEQVKPAPFPYGHRGLLSPGSQSMCVLTNKVLIILEPTYGNVSFINPDLNFIKSCNTINASRCQRYLFSHSESLLRRVVEQTKIYRIPPEKIGVKVYSGIEGKELTFNNE